MVDPNATWQDHHSEPFFGETEKDTWKWERQKVGDGFDLIGEGLCPRCGHPIKHKVTVGVYLVTAKTFTPTIVCGCEVAHAGSPNPGGLGCGYIARPTFDMPKESPSCPS